MIILLILIPLLNCSSIAAANLIDPPEFEAKLSSNAAEIIQKPTVFLEMVSTWVGDYALMRLVSKAFLGSYDSSRFKLIGEIEPALIPSIQVIKMSSSTSEQYIEKLIAFVKLYLQAKRLLKIDRPLIEALPKALSKLFKEYGLKAEMESFAKLFKQLHVLNRNVPIISGVDVQSRYLLHWIAKGSFSHLSNLVLNSCSTSDILELKSGRNPLHSALLHRNLEFAHLILDRFGSEDLIGAIDNAGHNSLYYAALSENLSIVERIIGLLNRKRSAILNQACTKNLFTPLNAAALSGNIQVFQVLLAAGSKLRPSNVFPLLSVLPSSSIVSAIQAGSVEIIKFILDLPEFENKCPTYLLSLSFEYKQMEIAEIISNHHRNPLSPLKCKEFLATLKSSIN